MSDLAYSMYASCVTECNVNVHKNCVENLPTCCKIKHKVTNCTQNNTMDNSPAMTIPSDELEGFEADSWSSSVSASFLQQQENSEVKRQDIIYELMQTEMHHVHNLHVMADVFADGMYKLLGFDEATVERLFPCQRELEEAHDAFLKQLYERWRCCVEEYGGGPNFIMHRIGDILVQQFSETSAKTLIDIYGEFCSRHKEAVDLYKALMSRKSFQSFINKQSQNPKLRRKGVQECMLLVTQRITKYPTLLGELLKHTKDDTEEHADVSKSLVLIKNIIKAVDERVHKRQTLIDFARRTDSKVQCRTKDGRVFKHADLLALGRRLLYDGNFNWRVSSGRIKDVHVLLMSDVMVFLQEKDQKYVFPSMKAAVISLHKMLVREVANEERAMFLISAAAHAEIYELHLQTKMERNIWMERIRQAVER
uniref:Uncharacterized protein n=1 Tax=Eptatretus burgeri TaxID=7764 RepID=A0A8C4QHK1_EPTBU